MLTLYHNDIAVCAQKVRLALAEKQAEFKSVHLDLRAGESHTPEYLKLNEKGVVPTLVTPAGVITESTIINEFIDDTLGGFALRPSDPVECARMRKLVMLTDTGLQQVCARVSFAVAFRHQEQSRQLASRPEPERAAQMERNRLGMKHPEAQAAARKYRDFVQTVNEALPGRRWLAGDDFSLAECALIPHFRRLDNLAMSWLWEGMLDTCRWWEACMARASFATAVAAWEPVSKIELMACKGREAITDYRAALSHTA